MGKIETTNEKNYKTIEEQKEMKIHEVPATARKLGLTKEQMIDMFKDHEFMSRRNVCIKYGFDKKWETSRQYTNAMLRIYNDILHDPTSYEEYVSGEEIKRISSIVIGRSYKPNAVTRLHGSVKEKVAQPVKDLQKKVEGIIGKMTNILDIKLDTVNNKKEIENMNLFSLTKSLAVMIDKGQILSGKATEHVAHIILEKGLNDMSSEELIKASNAQRVYDAETKS